MPTLLFCKHLHYKLVNISITLHINEITVNFIVHIAVKN